MMAFPLASPLPNEIVGGPQNKGPTLQSLSKISEKSALFTIPEIELPIFLIPLKALVTESAAAFALPKIPCKSRVALIVGPSVGFQSFTLFHLGSSSLERNESELVANPSTSSRASVA